MSPGCKQLCIMCCYALCAGDSRCELTLHRCLRCATAAVTDDEDDGVASAAGQSNTNCDYDDAPTAVQNCKASGTAPHIPGDLHSTIDAALGETTTTATSACTSTSALTTPPRQHDTKNQHNTPGPQHSSTALPLPSQLLVLAKKAHHHHLVSLGCTTPPGLQHSTPALPLPLLLVHPILGRTLLLLQRTALPGIYCTTASASCRLHRWIISTPLNYITLAIHHLQGLTHEHQGTTMEIRCRQHFRSTGHLETPSEHHDTWVVMMLLLLLLLPGCLQRP